MSAPNAERLPPPDLTRFMVRKEIKGENRDYLTVAGRLLWFRQDYPEAGIVSDILKEEWSEETGGIVYMRVSIFSVEGRLMATGHARQPERGPGGFADYVEKGETAALGRALLLMGYGTANAQEFEHEGKLAEAPAPARILPGGTGRQNPNSSDPTRRPTPTAAPRREVPPPVEARAAPSPSPRSPGNRNFDDSEAPGQGRVAA